MLWFYSLVLNLSLPLTHHWSVPYCVYLFGVSPWLVCPRCIYVLLRCLVKSCQLYHAFLIFLYSTFSWFWLLSVYLSCHLDVPNYIVYIYSEPHTTPPITILGLPLINLTSSTWICICPHYPVCYCSVFTLFFHGCQPIRSWLI